LANASAFAGGKSSEGLSNHNCFLVLMLVIVIDPVGNEFDHEQEHQPSLATAWQASTITIGDVERIALAHGNAALKIAPCTGWLDIAASSWRQSAPFARR
jgi:hypothetical protein